MITEKEADIASAGMEVMIHAAERFVEVLEHHYEQQIKERDEYKELKKKFGKQAASAYVKKLNHRLLMEDEKLRLGEWLDAARKLLRLTERFTVVAMKSKKTEEVTDCQMFDSLLNDANRMCELFCLYGNIPEENMLKATSSLKALGTKVSVPTEFIEREFKMKA